MPRHSRFITRLSPRRWVAVCLLAGTVAACAEPLTPASQLIDTAWQITAVTNPNGAPPLDPAMRSRSSLVFSPQGFVGNTGCAPIKGLSTIVPIEGDARNDYVAGDKVVTDKDSMYRITITELAVGDNVCDAKDAYLDQQIMAILNSHTLIATSRDDHTLWMSPQDKVTELNAPTMQLSAAIKK